MTEEQKKVFNIYRFLCFPWSAIIITPIWFTIVQTVKPLIQHLPFIACILVKGELPWWGTWVIFAVGEFFIILFLALYSYTLPKGKKNRQNIYILISSENLEDDKYITSDFIESFRYYFDGVFENTSIIVPKRIKREVFNETIQRCKRKNKNYWESRQWKRHHKRMNGVLYISGMLKRRSSGGKERYVFCLTATIGYNDINKTVTPLMIDELQKNFPSRIIVNREFELEEFAVMSNRFATFAEYIIGWAHLVSGHVSDAFRMHFDIFSNHKQSFFQRGRLKNLKNLLHIELDAIIRDCKLYPMGLILDCVEKAKEMFPNSETSTLLVARFLIMTSTDDAFDENLFKAESMLKTVKMNNKNRCIVLANQAYIYLLKGEYSKAEANYRVVFLGNDRKLIESIIEYCNIQIKDCCSKERPTALYVKAFMLSHNQDNGSDYINAIEQACNSIPDTYKYYHCKLSEMSMKTKKQKDKESKGNS